MEAFESFVALALEDEGLVVSEAQKFPVRVKTTSGNQMHGFEVDLVGANKHGLVLASVKSFFGSHGVNADHVIGKAKKATYNKRYALLNNRRVRTQVVRLAAERYGYDEAEVELRLYVGHFSGRKAGQHEARIRAWCARQKAGGGPIKVVPGDEVVSTVRRLATVSQYRNSAALVALKVLDEAGVLQPAEAAKP